MDYTAGVDTLAGIKVFRQIVESGSFVAAADRLDMSTAMVSKHVIQIEKRLSARLLNRNCRRLSLTEPGRVYYERCKSILDDLEQAELELGSLSKTPRGTLRVTAPVDLGHAVLPRIVVAYTAKYPDVSVDLIVTNRVVDMVKEGIDLAIRWAGSLKDSSFIARRFIETRSNLWASPKYLKRFDKLTHPQGLADARFLAHRVLKRVTLTNGKSEFELQLKGRVDSDDLEVIKALVMQGEGIAWLPDFLVADALEVGRLVPVLCHWRPKQEQLWTYHFVYAGRRYAMPKVEAFIQTALELV